jgi:hypothetical protein
MEMDFWNKEMTKEELFSALNKMINVKPLGLDGLSFDFYKAMRHIVGVSLFKMGQEAFTKGRRYKLIRCAIKLIPKKNLQETLSVSGTRSLY